VNGAEVTSVRTSSSVSVRSSDAKSLGVGGRSVKITAAPPVAHGNAFHSAERASNECGLGSEAYASNLKLSQYVEPRI
jgi:hypothetical protein